MAGEPITTMNSTPVKKTKGLLPWIIWGCGGLFYFYQFIIRTSPGYMTEELTQAFHVKGLALGVVVSFYYYAYAPMQIPLGLMLDRLGPRRVLMMSCSLCVLGCFLFASSPSYLSVACAGRFLMGMGSACAWIGSIKLATLWFPPERVGMIIGLTMFLGTMGPFFGGPVVAEFVKQIGWRQTMYLLGILGALLVALMAKMLSDCPPDLSAKPSSHEEGEKVSLLHGLKAVFLSSQVWINALYALLMYVPIAAFADFWGVSYMQRLYPIETPLAASIISATFFGISVGALVTTYFSDKIGSRRLPMILGSAGCLGIYCGIFYTPHIPLTAMYALTFLAGFFFSGQLMSFASAVDLVSPSLSGVVVGFTNMVVMLSGVVFQPFVGWLLDFSHGKASEHSSLYEIKDWKFALTSLVACVLLSLFLTFFIRETHPKTLAVHQNS